MSIHSRSTYAHTHDWTLIHQISHSLSGVFLTLTPSVKFIPIKFKRTLQVVYAFEIERKRVFNDELHSSDEKVQRPSLKRRARKLNLIESGLNDKRQNPQEHEENFCFILKNLKNSPIDLDSTTKICIQNGGQKLFMAIPRLQGR